MKDGARESMRGKDLPEEERRIREFLLQARWRKARDEAKPLAKLDRARYLPLLIEANAGLVREMLKKKQNSEARQVVAYLKTIAPKEVWQPLEAEIAIASNDFSSFASNGIHLLAQAASSISENEQRRLADQWVVAFEPRSSEDAPGSLSAELGAIHSALNHVSAERFDLATEILRPIGLHSVFRHWKLFVKGLIAFHQGDREKALKLLTGLPADSVVARASQPYLYWLNPEGKRLKDASEPVLHLLARYSGSAQSASTIVRAERLWREGNPQEMYSFLRKSIEEFPSERLDWIGALSAFSLNCPSILPWEKAGPFISYLEHLDRREKSDAERKMLLRILSLYFADSDPSFLQEEWDRYLRLRDRLDGPNDRLSSIAYEWLGTVLLVIGAGKKWNPELELGPLRKGRNMRAALDALEKSAKLDPQNINVQLLLVQLYERLKQHGQRNRLLDQMTVRFPGNKRVLFLAGKRCIDRKAYVKGLAYLTQALEHDRLDPAIPEAIVIARNLYALEQFRRGRADEARRTLGAANVLAMERQDDFIRSRWSMLLRQSILEQIYGDIESAEHLLASARAVSPGEETLLFLGHIVSQEYRQIPTGVDSFAKQFRAGLASATVRRAAFLLRIYEFWSSRIGDPPLAIAQSLLREYLRAAAKRPFSRAEACELIERIPRTSPFESERKPFIKSVLKKDRKDPLFRLFEYCDDDWGFQSIESRRRKLNEIMQEALRRKDDAAIQAVRRELKVLDSSIPERFPNIPDDWEDEEFEDDDFEEKGDLGLDSMLDAMTRSLSPKERGEFLKFAEMLGHASEQEARKLQKKIKPKGVPQFIFDMYLDVIRACAREQDDEPDIRSQKSKTKDPTQGSLF